MTPKDTQCGPVYEVIPNPPEVGDRPNEGFAIADMRGVKTAEPHYHANGETEIYIVINGLGRTIVGDKKMSNRPIAPRPYRNILSTIILWWIFLFDSQINIAKGYTTNNLPYNPLRIVNNQQYRYN